MNQLLNKPQKLVVYCLKCSYCYVVIMSLCQGVHTANDVTSLPCGYVHVVMLLSCHYIRMCTLQTKLYNVTVMSLCLCCYAAFSELSARLQFQLQFKIEVLHGQKSPPPPPTHTHTHILSTFHHNNFIKNCTNVDIFDFLALRPFLPFAGTLVLTSTFSLLVLKQF